MNDRTSRTTPTAIEDRQAIAEHYRGEARAQETLDARARWLGYRGEADFTDRAAAALERHRTLEQRHVRHARFIYFGVSK